MLSTAIVARPAKAGMKADKPLFIFKERGGREAPENFESWSLESLSCPKWS